MSVVSHIFHIALKINKHLLQGEKIYATVKRPDYVVPTQPLPSLGYLTCWSIAEVFAQTSFILPSLRERRENRIASSRKRDIGSICLFENREWPRNVSPLSIRAVESNSATLESPACIRDFSRTTQSTECDSSCLRFHRIFPCTTYTVAWTLSKL